MNANSKSNKTKDKAVLSVSEYEILCFIKDGYTSPQIAKLRMCSSRTIEKHRSNIIKKLDIPSTQNGLLLWVHKHAELFNT